MGLGAGLPASNLSYITLFSVVGVVANIFKSYSILLLHEPDFIEKIDYSKFNLILSGHSLNGG